MAVPASGELSLRGIRAELGTNNYTNITAYVNVSLTNMSIGSNGTINTSNPAANRPNGTAPHNMSEFYSYDHDVVAAPSRTSFSSVRYTTATCPATLNNTHYHDGSGTYPAVGDIIYDSDVAVEPSTSGYYFLSTSQAAVILDAKTGEVESIYTCPRSERRLKYNIEFIGDSPMGIPTYHFNYKDESHGKGRFIGTMVDDLERLGFTEALFTGCDGSIFVDYDMIDVPFHNITL